MMVLIQFRPPKVKRTTPHRQPGKGKILFFPVRYPEFEERWTASPLLSGFATYRPLPQNDDKGDHPK